MKESAFGKLGRDGFTSILLRMRPIDIVKLCWLTNLELCDNVGWPLLLQKGYGIKPENIPKDLEEQRKLFYRHAMNGYGPFYVSADSKEAKEVEFEDPHTKERIVWCKMPVKMRFLGYQKADFQAVWKDRVEGLGLEEIKTHPLSNSDVVYLVDDPNDPEVSPIPNPDGETFWGALLPGHRDIVVFSPVGKFAQSEYANRFSVLNSDLEYSQAEIDRIIVIRFCTDVIHSDYYIQKKDHDVISEDEIFTFLYENDYYVINRKVYQIGAVEFLPIWK